MKIKCLLRAIILLIICLISKNEAQQWIKLEPVFNPSGNYNMEKGIFLDENNGWFADGDKIFQTTDGGGNWDKKLSAGIISIDTPEMFFTNELTGWSLFTTQGDSSVIFKTTDGGRAWRRILTPKIGRFYFINENIGVGTAQDIIYKTTDGGITWQKINLEEYEGSLVINTIYFLDEKHGWMVGGRNVNSGYYRYPAILSTNDAGSSWKFSSFQTDLNVGLLSISFADSLNGVICDNTLYYHSTSDGGAAWVKSSTTLGYALYVVFTSAYEGWMTGAQGLIGHSIDKGKTWEKIKSPTTIQLGKISFVNNNTIGFIFAGQNTLLRYNKSVNELKENTSEIPTKTIMYQNYPNPFNPETKIKFSIPGGVETLHATSLRRVSLKVYDILGREIVTLLNENKSPGNYEIKFDAGNLPSGVYFYTLRAGDYVMTKKMILLR